MMNSYRTRRARIVPSHVMVLTPNEAFPTRKTVVVPEILIRTTGVEIACCAPVVNVAWIWLYCPNAPSVAEVVEIDARIAETVVEPAGVNRMVPDTSQSPAVRLTLVQFVETFVVSEVVFVVPVGISPTLPAFALLFVVVPTIPAVWEGVIAPVAVNAAVVTVPVKVGDASCA